MVESETSNAGRPMTEGVHETARFITLYGTPACLGLMAFYLVFAAFASGFSAGLRSLASALLPVVIISFLFVFSRTTLERLEAHTDELRNYDTSKGSIRFQADDPLPAALVRKLVKARIGENADRRTE